MTKRLAQWADASAGGTSHGGETTTSPWLLVFDLDGTLIDSSLDLCHSINAALAHVGRPALSQEAVSSFIGDGASALVRRSLTATEPLPRAGAAPVCTEAVFDEAFSFFLHYYREHKLDNTCVYPGVFPSLQAIRERHPELPMAVLTNKPVNPSREICAGLGLAPFFFANYGGNSFSSKKPDPEGLLTLMAAARTLRGGTLPQERMTSGGVVMIGDSDVDVRTARACGARSLGCRYGLVPEALMAARPDWTVDDPREWPAVLGL